MQIELGQSKIPSWNQLLLMLEKLNGPVSFSYMPEYLVGIAVTSATLRGSNRVCVLFGSNHVCLCYLAVTVCVCVIWQ